MPWKAPLFSLILMVPWPVPLLGVGASAVVAMTAQDFSLVVSAVAGGVGIGAAGLAKAYAIFKEAEHKDVKAQLDEIRAQFAEAKVERDSLRAENRDLRQKLAERDQTIADRDRVINDMLRKTAQLSEDVASLGEAFLLTKGDMKRRKAQP